MAVTHQPNRRGIHSFHPQDFNRWLGNTRNNYSDGLLGLIIAPAWAALSPRLVVVDDQTKVIFSRFKFDRRSKTFNDQVDLIKRFVRSVSTPIRLVITRIAPATVTLVNASDLPPDDSPYVEVPFKDSFASSIGVKDENLR